MIILQYKKSHNNINGGLPTVFFCLDKNKQIVYNQLRVLSSMDRMPCFELGDVGSIPAGPANTALNTISDNSKKGVQHGCSSTRYLGRSPAMDLK